MFQNKIESNVCDCICFSGVGLLNIQYPATTISVLCTASYFDLYRCVCRFFRESWLRCVTGKLNGEKRKTKNENENKHISKTANKTATVPNIWCLCALFPIHCSCCLRLAVTSVQVHVHELRLSFQRIHGHFIYLVHLKI